MKVIWFIIAFKRHIIYIIHVCTRISTPSIEMLLHLPVFHYITFKICISIENTLHCILKCITSIFKHTVKWHLKKICYKYLTNCIESYLWISIADQQIWMYVETISLNSSLEISFAKKCVLYLYNETPIIGDQIGTRNHGRLHPLMIYNMGFYWMA